MREPMFFKNLQVFDIDEAPAPNPIDIESAMEGRPLVPCPSMSFYSSGWVPVYDGGRVLEAAGQHYMAVQGIEERVLPVSVIKRAAKKKADDWERARGFKPGRKLLRDIKDQCIIELLPQAFVRPRTIRGWIDAAARRIIVDSPSATRAEGWIGQLRDAIPNHPPISVPKIEMAPSAVMAAWLANPATVPAGIALGESCQLSGTEDKSTVRFTHHPLDTGQVRSLIVPVKYKSQRRRRPGRA